MKTTAKIINIGNSKGLRLPKRLLEELQLGDEVQLESKGKQLVITSIEGVHDGWEESAKELRIRGDDALLLEAAHSSWDATEWEW